MELRAAAIGAALAGFHATGLDRLAARVARGRGIVLTLHHVSPETPPEFAPNALLTVTPAFLAETVRTLRDRGFEIVDLDTALDRLAAPPAGARPFAVLTFDDAYRDFRDHALPVLRTLDAPATLYVVSAFAAGRGFMWWRALEAAIRALPEIPVRPGIAPIPSDSAAAKAAAWRRLYWDLRSGPEARLIDEVARLAALAGYDAHADCAAMCLTWDELRPLARDPLVTIGAHSVHHRMLAKWDAGTARDEMAVNRDDIGRELGVAAAHFAYPVGAPDAAGEREFAMAAELGFRSAVTTRPDHLRDRHAALAHALPRVSLNGLFQHRRYLGPLLSGAPFLARNLLRRG